MILEDLKSLIKDFEEVLIKDERFKNDYKFKSQVRTIYGLRKVENVFVPFPVGTGEQYGKNIVLDSLQQSRDRIVEKRVEVPVDRIVEKRVDKPCPECLKCPIGGKCPDCPKIPECPKIPVINCPKCKICEICKKENLVNLSVEKADDLPTKLEQDVKQIESIRGDKTKLTPEEFEELVNTKVPERVLELSNKASDEQRFQYLIRIKDKKFYSQKYLSILKDIKDKEFATKLLDMY